MFKLRQMSLYPVSNFNIGTGVATEVLDSISSADGTLVVTFTNGVATFISPIVGTITNSTNTDNIQITSDNADNANYALIFVKINSGYQPVYVADATIYINPSVGTLYATNFVASQSIESGIILAQDIYFPSTGPITNDQTISWNSTYGLVITSQTTSSFGGRILLDRVSLQGGSGKNGASFDSVYGLDMSDAPIYGVTTLTLDSTTSGSADYYQMEVSGITGAGIFKLNWFNGTTTANPLSLDANGLLWIGTTAQTGVGLKLSDRTTANYWEQFSTANDLTFNYTTATKLKITETGQVDILGSSAALNLADRNNNSLLWTTYNNVTILRWYYNGADRMYLESDGTLGLDADLDIGVANPATATINMKATTLCRITTSLATQGTINMNIGSSDISSGTVSGNVSTFEISTSDMVFYSNSTLFNGTPLSCSRFGDCSLYHYNAAALGTATYYVSCYWNSGSPIGGIKQVNATTISFPTTSDRRLKEQIEDLTEDFVGNIFDNLKPRSYIWKEAQEPAIGFIADELQSVLPDCVFGEPNAVNSKGEDEYQVADCASPSMIAVLVAEIQFLRKRVALLESR